MGIKIKARLSGAGFRQVIEERHSYSHSHSKGRRRGFNRMGSRKLHSGPKSKHSGKKKTGGARRSGRKYTENVSGRLWKSSKSRSSKPGFRTLPASIITWLLHWKGKFIGDLIGWLEGMDRKMTQWQRKCTFYLVLLCWSGLLFYLLGTTIRITWVTNRHLSVKADSIWEGNINGSSSNSIKRKVIIQEVN